MTQVKKLELSAWKNCLSKPESDLLTQQLEQGSAFVLPNLKFLMLDKEINLLDKNLVEPGRKNISFNFNKNILKGVAQTKQDVVPIVKDLMHRYAENTQELVNGLFPFYQKNITLGRTSLRVLDTASNKPSSYRKDDSRLHVDAFPATPMHGKRILRVFQNINPNGANREWRVGESFEDLIKRFRPLLTKPLLGSRKLLAWLKITKQYRTLYDHYMLQLHHIMKQDINYQKTVEQENLSFAPGTTWIVYSDLVSHAAMAGQHMLEQTFYIDAQDQLYPELSPLSQLENSFGCELI